MSEAENDFGAGENSVKRSRVSGPGGMVLTALESTPKRTGSVCAVTSYGWRGGPPGYSRMLG